MTFGDRRAAMLDALADHVRAHSLSGSSLCPLAKAAGISHNGLVAAEPLEAAGERDEGDRTHDRRVDDRYAGSLQGPGAIERISSAARNHRIATTVASGVVESSS